jgi:hypothetical protein
MIKFAVETANIPMTQESSHVEITNENNAHHFLRSILMLLFALNSFHKVSQPSLLHGNTEVVM